MKKHIWVLILGFLSTTHLASGMRAGDAAGEGGDVPQGEEEGAASDSRSDDPKEPKRRFTQEGDSWRSHQAEALSHTATKSMHALEAGKKDAEEKLPTLTLSKKALSEGLCDRRQWDILVRDRHDWGGRMSHQEFVQEMGGIFNSAAEKPDGSSHKGGLHVLGRCKLFADHGKLTPETAHQVQADHKNVHETLQTVLVHSIDEQDRIRHNAATAIQTLGMRPKLARKKAAAAKAQHAADVDKAKHLFDSEDGEGAASADGRHPT